MRGICIILTDPITQFLTNIDADLRNTKPQTLTSERFIIAVDQNFIALTHTRDLQNAKSKTKISTRDIRIIPTGPITQFPTNIDATIAKVKIFTQDIRIMAQGRADNPTNINAAITGLRYHDFSVGRPKQTKLIFNFKS